MARIERRRARPGRTGFIRFFGKLRFKSLSAHGSKVLARERADEWRRLGFMARVTRGSVRRGRGAWVVWRGPKRKGRR